MPSELVSAIVQRAPMSQAAQRSTSVRFCQKSRPHKGFRERMNQTHYRPSAQGKNGNQVVQSKPYCTFVAWLSHKRALVNRNLTHFGWFIS